MKPKSCLNTTSQSFSGPQTNGFSDLYDYEIRCANGTEPQRPERDLELEFIKDLSKNVPSLETLTI